jgi:hypothetical protein
MGNPVCRSESNGSLPSEESGEKTFRGSKNHGRKSSKMGRGKPRDLDCTVEAAGWAIPCVGPNRTDPSPAKNQGRKRSADRRIMGEKVPIPCVGPILESNGSLRSEESGEKTFRGVKNRGRKSSKMGRESHVTWIALPRLRGVQGEEVVTCYTRLGARKLPNCLPIIFII